MNTDDNGQGVVVDPYLRVSVFIGGPFCTLDNFAGPR
jgi:hypothetical protein